MPTTIDLMGWDTVNAISFDSMNNAVLQLKSFPSTFSNTEDDVSLTGTWKDWRLCTGGSGPNIQMQCDIATGALVMDSAKTDLSGGWVKIQVNLEDTGKTDPSFKDPTGKGDGTGHSLVLKKTVTNDVPAVVVLSTSFDAHTSLKFVVKGMFEDALNTQLDAFTQFFHSVLLNETADVGDYQWLKPTAYSYAVTDGDTTADSVFGAVCMVEGDKPVDDSGNPLVAQVDGRLLEDLPAGANSVFAISAEKFVQHVLKVGAQRVIPGTTDADFELAEDGLAITNNKDLQWGEFVLDSGEKVTPTIPASAFRMSLEVDQIKLEFTGVHFISYRTTFGDVVSINLTQFFKIGTQKKSDGSGYALIVKNDADDTDIPAIDFHATVTPTQAEQNFDWAIIGIGAALAVLPVATGLFKLGQGAIQVGSKLINVVRGAGDAAEVGIELTEMTPLLEQEGVVAAEDVSDAADVADTEAVAGTPRSGMALKNLTLANKFCLAGGIVTFLVGISDPIGKALAQHDVSKIPSIDGFASACLGASSWPNMSNWGLVDARLAGALVLYGNLAKQS